MQYLLSLDAGTTSLKGMLFDVHGRQAAWRLEEYELSKPAPDIVQLDPEVYWEAAKRAVRAVLATSGAAPQDVAAMGVTSQGETLIVVDRDGRPLRPAIVWLDNRTREQSEAIDRDFNSTTVYRVTGQPEMIPTWSATRILWLRRHEPAVFQQAYKYLMVEDYLIYRLTGRFATDRALSASTLYYDLTTGCWWPEMLQYLGISEEQLPELKDSGEVAGEVSESAARETGLRPGTLVTTAPIDQVAGAVGAGNLEPGVITETTGAALAICATLGEPLYDPLRRVGLYGHAVRGRFVLLPWIPTAGMVLRWFRDELGGGNDYDQLVEQAQAIPEGAEGLIVLPHLSGAGSPEPDPRVKGVFWGVTLGHRRGHFVRAILESIAYVLRSNLTLLEELGMQIREVRSLGGAARSDLWLQIKADVCRKDLLVMACDEAASLGVAMIASVAAGIHRDLAAASNAMVDVHKRVPFDPDAAERYDAAYVRYADLYRHVKGLFH
ncbi:MAG: hypothetical protein HUU20_25145 [Pirellulales bacterium]|nr:hypothetical protein [Pirellulales bacterium]